MAYQNNKPTLHRKEFQMMSPSPVTNAAGMNVISDPLGIEPISLYMTAANGLYAYDNQQDGWTTALFPNFGGTFGAGACSCWSRWSFDIAASAGGSTTTILFPASNIAVFSLIGKTVWITSGAAANVGLRRTISNVEEYVPGNYRITVSQPFNSAITSGNFKVDTGSFYILNSYTSLVSDIFKVYNVLTGQIGSVSTTGLPASWGTDGRLVSTPSYVGSFVTGTATSGASNALTDNTKTFIFNGLSNFQIRITAGTGAGQIRNISANSTAGNITVSTAWTTIPDATSQYVIEGNDDYLYLLGNNAVTMYRYSISANSWTTLSPTAARAAAPGTGMGANWIAKTGNSSWSNPASLQDGRYIYSFRGAATSTLHRYDIALNTWTTINYIRGTETFTTGSSYTDYNGNIYINKESSGRFFYYDVLNNTLNGLTTEFYPQSTAVVGNKTFLVSYNDGDGGDVITWLYYLGNSTTTLRRLMIY